MAINLAGYLYSDNGSLIDDADVTLLASDGSTENTTTTNATGVSGYWTFAEADEDIYDIKIQSGSQIRYIKGKDKLSVAEIDVRNNAAATTPAFTFTNYTTSTTSHQVGKFRSLNSSAADNDEIYLSFNLQNSASEDTEYARITAKAIDVTNGEEDGQLEFQVLKSGNPVQAFTITSSTTGGQSIDFNQDAFTFGQGGDTDITLTFDANTADGVITWMEDEDYFKFSDEILMNSTEKLLFGDTGTFIHQSSDGVLTITSDTTVDINGAVVFDGVLTGGTWQGTAIATTYIADDAITSAKIADDAVVSAAIADDAITSALIADDAITTALIADDAITSALIADDAVVTAAIADDAITSALIADDAVVTAAIADNAITNALMADDAIDSDEIAAGAIDLAHMNSQSVDEDNLYISNSGSDGQFLSKQSGNSGGLTWATPSAAASTVTVTDSTSDTNFPVVFHDESNGLLDDTGALRYNPSTGTLLAPNLTVAGTTTTVDTVTMNAENAVVFEGATADGYETTLSVVDPTADHTQYLINQGGYIPLLAASTTTAISATPAEINLIDGGTARGTTAVASGDGILINDGGTMRMTNVDTVSTYFSSHNVGGGAIVTTGALDSGSITSGFGNIDNGSSTITTTGAADLGATTVDSLTSTGDITTTGQATDWDLIDNTASALSFDASGKTGILEIDTRDGAERVTMSGGLVITGDLTVTGDDITMGTNTDTAIMVADGTNFNPVVPSGVIDLANNGAFTVDNTFISSQTEITSGLAAADELLYSDAGTVKKVGLDTLTTYLAGVNAGTVTSTGISDSSGVLTLDIQNMTASSTIADADLIVIDDGAGGTLRKMTRANFIESAALDAIDIDGGAIDGTAIGASSAAAGTFAALISTTFAPSDDITMAADKSLNLPQGANIKFTDAITQDSIEDDDHQGIIMTFTAGSTVTQYSPVYLGTDDEVHECDADAIATMPCIGVSINTSDVTDGNPIEVMLLGLIRNEDFTDFGTNGAPVFVSTTVGVMSNTAPSDTDDVVQIVGHSIGEKLLFVQPSLSYVVVA